MNTTLLITGKDEWWMTIGVCLNCGHDNPERANYCMHCGAEIKVKREAGCTDCVKFSECTYKPMSPDRCFYFIPKGVDRNKYIEAHC